MPTFQGRLRGAWGVCWWLGGAGELRCGLGSGDQGHKPVYSIWAEMTPDVSAHPSPSRNKWKALRELWGAQLSLVCPRHTGPKSPAHSCTEPRPWLRVGTSPSGCGRAETRLASKSCS